MGITPTHELPAKDRRVGWPFRILGALLVAACAGAVLASLYGAFVDHRVQFAVFALAMLPTSALIIRTVGLVVITGTVPEAPLWPFPSGQVAVIWIVISGVAVQMYAAR